MEVVDIKKSYLSIIVILCTITSVVLMTHDFNVNDEKEYIRIINKNEKEVLESESLELVNNDVVKNDIEERDNNSIEDVMTKKITEVDATMKNNNDQNNIPNNVNITNNNEKDSIYISSNTEYEENVEIKNENNEGIDILNEEDISVFKVDADTILDELTLNQKKTLLFLGTKFSPVDYAKMKDYLYMTNREEGVSCALKLAEKRLTKEDFKKMKDVIDEYIDIDAIEKKDYK